MTICLYQVYKFFLNPHKITSDEHISWFNNSYIYNVNRIDFIAYEKVTNRKIGVFGIVKRDDSFEVNYLLDKSYRGFGYAYECVYKLISIGKELFNSNHVIAEIHKDNTSSINLIKKLGFDISSNNGNFITYRRKI